MSAVLTTKHTPIPISQGVECPPHYPPHTLTHSHTHSLTHLSGQMDVHRYIWGPVAHRQDVDGQLDVAGITLVLHVLDTHTTHTALGLLYDTQIKHTSHIKPRVRSSNWAGEMQHLTGNPDKHLLQMFHLSIYLSVSIYLHVYLLIMESVCV